MGQDIGARYQIIVDGTPRSYRDDKAIAIEAGLYLKEQRPTSGVIIRDIATSWSAVVGWEKGKAIVQP
jgi:hypothetical protein